MTNGSGLSASDVMAIVGNKDDGFFGNSGGAIAVVLGIIIVFIILFRRNDYSPITAQLQNSLYNQSTDSAIRGLAQGQCGITEQVMSSNYDNALLLKDVSNQISNSVAGLGNLIQNQTATITNLFNEQTIDRLRDQVSVLRGQNSNLVQTAQIDGAITNSTNTILNSLGQWHAYPPCYTNCSCGCNSLY